MLDFVTRKKVLVIIETYILDMVTIMKYNQLAKLRYALHTVTHSVHFTHRSSTEILQSFLHAITHYAGFCHKKESTRHYRDLHTRHGHYNEVVLGHETHLSCVCNWATSIVRRSY